MSIPSSSADAPAGAPLEQPPAELRAAKRNGRSSPLAAALGAVAPPLDLRILGRTLLHTALVGFIAGLLGAAFFAALEYTQAFLLENAAGYTPLRAHGEKIVGAMGGLAMHPIVMLFLPAVGALLGGLVCLLAPETRGGGGDAMIHSFHHQGGVVRARVIWVKALASILTLGSGGSGGREGPTMQMGGALGSAVGLALKVGSRERRILMIAGVAAGMAAVFRTPLGAALLAAEVLYRDDFEAEALVPAVLASVIAYSVVISIFGESTLFARAPRYPFIPRHLPLYGLLAVLVAFVASLFLSTLRGVQELSARLPIPVWARPAAGGLALSLIAVPLILVVGARIGSPGRALGIFGGGYGAAQIAIAGAEWLPLGWRGAELLLFLGLAKLLATSFTIGTGGSAGDFGPSLVLGGLFGGAFGHAAKALLHDPSIDPGAFALVGMGTFYGGLAHVPVSSLVMVCELAGSYDLLVPLMLAEGIAFVALRKRFLYEAQLPTHADSPVHRVTDSLEALARRRVSDVLVSRTPFHAFEADTKLPRMRSALAEARWQTTFPVLDREGKLIGLVSATSVGLLQPAAEPPEGRVARDTSGVHGEVTALHIMQPPAALDPADDLRKAAELILLSGFRQLPVIGADHKILGFLEESEITRAYLGLDPRRGEDSHRDPEAA